MKTILKTQYQASICCNAEGVFSVAFAYRDGDKLAAVPGFKVKHYDTEEKAVAAANRGLAKLCPGL